MKFLFLAVLFSCASSEAGDLNITVRSYPSWWNPDTITRFDDRVFDLNSAKPAVSTSVTGTSRYVDEPPEYNSAQRRAWMRLCAPEKKKSFAAFRECFEVEKTKALETVRQSFEAVEKRNSQPLRNTPPRPR